MKSTTIISFAAIILFSSTLLAQERTPVGKIENGEAVITIPMDLLKSAFAEEADEGTSIDAVQIADAPQPFTMIATGSNEANSRTLWIELEEEEGVLYFSTTKPMHRCYGYNCEWCEIEPENKGCRCGRKVGKGRCDHSVVEFDHIVTEGSGGLSRLFEFNNHK